MKKYLVLSVALMLSACGGFESKQDFLQDAENQNKYNELSAKYEKTSDCDNLEKLYNFTHIESPTTDDLAQILPSLGLTAKDATDVDKVYKINYSIIDKYDCKNNAKQLLSEGTKYCEDKYYENNVFENIIYFPYRATAAVAAFTIVGGIPFVLVGNMMGCHGNYEDTAFHPAGCKRKTDCEKYLIEDIQQYTNINKEKLKTKLEAKVKSVFPKVEYTEEYLLQEFKIGELIKARQTVIGTYDKTYNYGEHTYFECSSNPWLADFCDKENGQVTKLNVARVLYTFCKRQLFLPDDADDKKCICYAHSAYNTMSYKNALFIYENDKMPQSKQSEFRQMFNKCEQKIKQQQINSNKNRYGDANYSGVNDAVFTGDAVKAIVDVIGNAM